MPQTLVMQEMVTITPSVSGQIITQQENLWPDLTGYQDMGLIIYFAQVPTSFTGSPALFIETAPLKEEDLFTVTQMQLVSVTAAPTTNPGWNFYGPWHMSTNALFTRFLRWRITNGTSSSVNTWQFRIVLVLNPSPR